MNLRPLLPLRQAPSLAVCILTLAPIMHGCVAPGAQRPASDEASAVRWSTPAVIARDRDLAIVIVQQGEDLPSLAGRYLGDRGKAWWIADFNGIGEVRPGQEIVIPMQPRNPVGVYANGIQTIPILCYHRFGSGAGKLQVTPAVFEAQMDYLAQNRYRVIPLKSLIGFLEGKEPLPRKAVVITIDDGYRSTYDVAYPILKQHGFPATLFLYSDFVGAGGAVTWAQMQEMARSGLIDIQPHSKTHGNLALRLARESDAQYRERVRREIEMPSNAILERLAEKTYSFAYPYGDMNESVAEQLARRGVSLGLTVTPGGNAFFANPYMLRRTMVFGGDDLDEFKSKLTVFARANWR